MIKYALFIAGLGLTAAAFAQETEADLVRTYTVNLTTGLNSTFQPPLGPAFGAGPAAEDKLTVSLNNAFRNGDSLSFFGWSTTDIPSVTPDWMSGLLYKTPLLRKKDHKLTVTGGLQRWMLRDVGTGSNDWLFTGNLTYGTKLKNIPFFVSEESFSLLTSTLPKGSALYTRVYAEHKLIRGESFQLMLREGPEHAYSWGFYGLEGHCVARYAGSLVATWKGNTVEAGYRRQFGLQDGIPTNGFWSFSISRELARPLRAS